MSALGVSGHGYCNLQRRHRWQCPVASTTPQETTGNEDIVAVARTVNVRHSQLPVTPEESDQWRDRLFEVLREFPAKNQRLVVVDGDRYEIVYIALQTKIVVDHVDAGATDPPALVISPPLIRWLTALDKRVEKQSVDGPQ